MELDEAAEELDHPEFWYEESLAYYYPEAEILEEMLAALGENPTPKKRQAVLSQYRKRALQAFTTLLDTFTTPEVPDEGPRELRYPLPRSAPQDQQS